MLAGSTKLKLARERSSAKCLVLELPPGVKRGRLKRPDPVAAADMAGGVD
jgi:hypothetical protein